MNTSTSTVLITGAAGFIGAAFAEKLLHAGPGISVIGIDNLNDYYDPALKKARLEKVRSAGSRFTFYAADITDRTAMETIFRETKPDVVVHLAAQAGVRKSVEDPDAYVSANILGFYTILEVCRAASIRHLIYASSSSVYGESRSVPFSESDRTDEPVSFYAATKKTNELMAHAYSKLYGMQTTGLRFFTVYGPMGRPDMAYYKFSEMLRKGETIKIYNSGNCMRDFTYIDDVTQALLAVVKGTLAGKNEGYRIYNIGHSSPVNLLDFVRILRDALCREGVLPSDFDLDAHMELIPAQPGDVPDTYADVSALQRDFGVSPSTDIREGLRSFAAWYKRYTANS